jgi:hypothetical protein
MSTIKSFQDTRFAGHESFVLRLGWLRKMYDLASTNPAVLKSDEEAIHALGIGRNMVRSLEFWADACSVTRRSDEGLAPGPLGDFLFRANSGADPYMESIDSVALVHCPLCHDSCPVS